MLAVIATGVGEGHLLPAAWRVSPVKVALASSWPVAVHRLPDVRARVAGALVEADAGDVAGRRRSGTSRRARGAAVGDSRASLGTADVAPERAGQPAGAACAERPRSGRPQAHSRARS